MKAYKIYNFRGNYETFSFIPLNDEVMDEIEVRPAVGFEICEDAYGIPYLMESETKIPYDIGLAKENDNKTLVAQAIRVNNSGNLERIDGTWKTIAVIC